MTGMLTVQPPDVVTIYHDSSTVGIMELLQIFRPFASRTLRALARTTRGSHFLRRDEPQANSTVSRNCAAESATPRRHAQLNCCRKNCRHLDHA
jgi:hypothetical protein